MAFFRDLFYARRRSAPRVAADWMVDLAVPNTDPQHWVGLFATDLSAEGIRLRGLDSAQIRRLIDKIERAQMKLRLPGMRPPLPQVIAELRWGLGDDANFSTGWRFAEIDAQTLRIIDAYIADHPQDLIVDPA